jgi:glucose/arabinose dehydrogenase
MFYSKRMTVRMLKVATLACCFFVAAGCSDSPSTTRSQPRVTSPLPEPSSTHEAKPIRGPVEIDLELAAEGFDSPLGVVNAGDGSDDLFVVEQGGRIWRISKGEIDREPFLEIPDLIVAGGEQGLLGLAFHPDHGNNGLFYVNYTDTSGDTVIAEYHRNGNQADAGSARILLHIDQPYSNHNGGNVVFGPDGYLYIGMGDGGAGGDPEKRAQNPQELLGKMLRIDVDHAIGDGQYGIPEDNPFVGGGGRPEIWALGMRNPWRFSFDREGGDLWIGDVGQSALEEIDRAPSDEAGINWGWDVLEGTECYEPSDGCDDKGKTPPVSQYDHSLGCAVTGGYVYRGDRQGALSGRYIFGDYCSGLLWTLYSDPGTEFQEPLPAAQTGLSISSFGESEDGEIYLTDISGGGLYHLVVR